MIELILVSAVIIANPNRIFEDGNRTASSVGPPFLFMLLSSEDLLHVIHGWDRRDNEGLSFNYQNLTGNCMMNICFAFVKFVIQNFDLGVISEEDQWIRKGFVGSKLSDQSISFWCK